MNVLYSTVILLFLSFQEPAYTSLIEDLSKVSSENSIPCENEWYYFGEKCYKVEGYEGSNASVPLSWNDARNRCKEMGGHLVSIHSIQENDFITDLLTSLNIKVTIHIGLSDYMVESFFEWDDRTPYDYTNWAPGQPSNYMRREDCVEFLTYPLYSEKAGGWNDEQCNLQRPYMCKKASNDSFSSPNPLLCSPEEGAGFRYLESCYNIINEKLSWADAEKYCQNFSNGHLAMILDKEHESFLNSVLPRTKDRRWIGIKIKDKFQPKWSSGFPVVYEQLEVPFENLERNLCILRWKENVWTSTSCQQKLPFICEVSRAENTFSDLSSQVSRCPNSYEGWKDLGGNFCYHFDRKSILPFYDAQYECIKKGGVLASILSEEDETVLSYIAKSYPSVYIGLNSLYTLGTTFIWSDGRHIDYTHWAAGEPNHLLEMCVELLTPDMTWNDIPCSIEKRYICQVEKVRFSTEEEAEDYEGYETINARYSTEDNETEATEYEYKASASANVTYQNETGDTIYTFMSEKIVTKEVEEISSPLSLSVWNVLGIALFFLGITFGISVYISRKWLKKKLERLPTIRFKKSDPYNKFQNAESSEIVINSEEEASHL